MLNKIGESLKHPFWAAMAGSIVPTLVSAWAVFYTYSYTSELQLKQAMNELSAKFDEASGDVIDVSIAFIGAINDAKDLTPVKANISQAVARQIANSQKFRKNEVMRKAVDDYVSALSEFNSITQATKDATDAKLWAEGFDKVVASRETLSQTMRLKSLSKS